jgi:hypothetical protein
MRNEAQNADRNLVTRSERNKMRPIIFVAMISTICGASGQTTVSFTNSEGKIIPDARITATNSVTLYYETQDGPAHIRWADLPPEVQRRFGYNPAQGAEAEKALVARKQAIAQAAANAAVTRRVEKEQRERTANAEKIKMIIQGRVIQRISAGLLVNSASELRKQVQHYPGEGYGTRHWEFGGVQVFEGLCLLTDVEGGALDGDIINCTAYPNGNYSYTAVSGGEKTVRRFTANPARIAQMPSEREMELIKQDRPD